MADVQIYTLPPEIDAEHRPMKRCIPPEQSCPAVIFIILIQGAVPADKGDMFERLPVNKACKLPGEIRSHTEPADITSHFEGPSIGKAPQPAQAHNGIDPVFEVISDKKVIRTRFLIGEV